MKILRYTIFALSISVVVIWIIFGRSQGLVSDLVPIVWVFFFIANAFYIFFSKPTFKLSEFCDRTATKQALVTLEIKYQASQAKFREIEAERIKADTEEKKADRLTAAKEFMNFAANNPQVKKLFDLSSKNNSIKNADSLTPQITMGKSQVEIPNKNLAPNSDNSKFIQ